MPAHKHCELFVPTARVGPASRSATVRDSFPLLSPVIKLGPRHPRTTERKKGPGLLTLGKNPTWAAFGYKTEAEAKGSWTDYIDVYFSCVYVYGFAQHGPGGWKGGKRTGGVTGLECFPAFSRPRRVAGLVGYQGWEDPRTPLGGEAPDPHTLLRI